MKMSERIIKLGEVGKTLTILINEFNNEDLSAYAAALLEAKMKTLAVYYDFKTKGNNAQIQTQG